MNLDWLGFGIAFFGAAFGLIMSVRGRGDNPGRFMNFAFEGVILATGTVTLISSFVPAWFDALAGQKVFLIVLSLAAILSALQNVGRTLDWRKPQIDE